MGVCGVVLGNQPLESTRRERMAHERRAGFDGDPDTLGMAAENGADAARLEAAGGTLYVPPDHADQVARVAPDDAPAAVTVVARAISLQGRLKCARRRIRRKWRCDVAHHFRFAVQAAVERFVFGQQRPQDQSWRFESAQSGCVLRMWRSVTGYARGATESMRFAVA